MSSIVTGLRIPWTTAQANNPAFDVSAAELNDPLNQIVADANIDWQTTIQDNITALDQIRWNQDGLVVGTNREIVGLAGGLALNVPTTTPIDNRINDVSIFRINETNLLSSVPLDMGSNLISNVTDPASPQDAATRAYVDAQVAGGTIVNVGAGTGSIFRDESPVNTFNLRTLLQGANITITTAGDEVTIANTGVVAHNLLSATHSDTLASSPPAQGSLIKGNGSSQWAEFTLGAATQVLRVNAAGTDLEFFSVPGATDELVNVFEAGTQVGAVARQLNFANGDDFGIVENAGQNRFDISISRNVANGIAGLDATGRLTASELPTTVAYIDSSNAWADGVKQTFNPNATNAGLNWGSEAGDPSTLVNGDTWYNSSTNKFRGRENGVSVDFISSPTGTLNIIQQLDSNVEVIDAATGQIDFDVDGGLQMRLNVASGLVMSNDINLSGTNNILDVGFLESSGTVPTTGAQRFLRMSTAVGLSWRNQANDGDIDLLSDANDRLTYDGAFVQRQAYASALGDETTDATVSDSVRYAFPYAFEVTRVTGFARTAPTGASLNIQFQNITQAQTIATVNIGAGSNFQGQTTITNPDIAEDDIIEVSITQIGSTVAGAGVKGTMIGFVA